jgi:hypothetical protein
MALSPGWACLKNKMLLPDTIANGQSTASAPMLIITSAGMSRMPSADTGSRISSYTMFSKMMFALGTSFLILTCASRTAATSTDANLGLYMPVSASLVMKSARMPNMYVMPLDRAGANEM